MEAAQFVLVWFEAGKLDQITFLEESGEALLLLWRQQSRSLQIEQKFFRSPLRGAKAESFFKINAQRIGNSDAEEARILNKRQGFAQPLSGPNVRRNHDGRPRFEEL